MVTSRRSATKKVVPKKARIDWDAVERDYRTDKFTLRELAEKYGISHQAIAKQAKLNAWSKDLSAAIKQATNAKLVDELVAKEVAKSGQEVANVVLAAAAVNTRIIRGHQQQLAALQEAIEIAKQKLLTLGDTVADIREGATFVQAINNIATATKTAIEQERKAHNLDAEPEADQAKQKRVMIEFVEAGQP
jgi:predicted DNA-binding protein YlxM (UPF0122 family)